MGGVVSGGTDDLLCRQNAGSKGGGTKC